MSALLRPLASGKLPKEPLQAIRPVDQIKMAHTNQGSFVVAPLTRLYAGIISKNARRRVGATMYLTNPSLSPSVVLIMECEAANTDHIVGSREAPYE